MPPRKIISNNNYWYLILSILLTILIILLSFYIYLLYKNPKVITKYEKIVEQHPIQITKHEQPQPQVIIIKEQKQPDIPIYPKELPLYNKKEYQQVGILTSNEEDKNPIVLPLFSRKLQHNKDRFNYYTATDKNNMMRLPIKIDNMSCEDTIGCREIYDNDKISLEIYKGRIFTATIYKLDVPQYF